jgi:exodeoxyribonuclease VII small subunit
MSKAASQPPELSFEDAMSRLDEIVGAMETDRMPLEEMIRSYEEGIALLKNCRQRLDGARRRVELISADLESGKASTSSFDADAAAEQDDASIARQSPPKRRKASEGDEIRLF